MSQLRLPRWLWLLPAAALTYVFFGWLLFPEWWRLFFFEGGFRSRETWATGVTYLFVLRVPIVVGLLIVAVVATAIRRWAPAQIDALVGRASNGHSPKIVQLGAGVLLALFIYVDLQKVQSIQAFVTGQSNRQQQLVDPADP